MHMVSKEKIDMNAFKRLGDIISSNINSALDKAEDPEKMIDLSIKKLEDSRCDIRAAIAEKSAEKSAYEKKLEGEREAIARWTERARLAVGKGRDDMAREAIAAKQDLEKSAKDDQNLISSLGNVLISLNETLSKIEEKLSEMKAKSAELKARARSAKERIKANEAMAKSSDAQWLRKIEELNSRIERWEAEANITAPAENKTMTFEEMEKEEAIEAELRRIKENA